MALTHAYASLSMLKRRIGITDAADDSDLERALEASSRAVDDYTGRRFWADASSSTRHYETDGSREVDIEDVASSAGVVVLLDRDDDGIYEETLASTDWWLAPVDALADGRPFTRLMFMNRTPRASLRPALALTAIHGWPGGTVTNGIVTCSEQIVEATLLASQKLWRRKDTPEGIAGTLDTGVIRISRYEDPDVCRLLKQFVKGGEVLVA